MARVRYLKIIQLGTSLIFFFRISITTKIKALKFSILHFVFRHRNKHLHTLNNLLDMATGYANCVLGSDGCDALQHTLTIPRTIQSVKRIAPVNKTPITELVSLESIFVCFCSFFGFFCAFWLCFAFLGYLCPFFRCVFFSLFGTVLKPLKDRMSN
jgi:hypothetical protein